MLFLGIFLLLAVVAVICLTFLLGFRLGGQSAWAESQRVRAQAAAAERELHNLTRSAFVAMAEEVDRQRRH